MQLSALLMWYFAVDANNFDNIVWLRIATLVLHLAPIPFFWLLPSELDVEEMRKEKGDR